MTSQFYPEYDDNAAYGGNGYEGNDYGPIGAATPMYRPAVTAFGGGHGPVSYTHLTLPTKRKV